MHKDLVTQPKSSFLSYEKDVEIIKTDARKNIDEAASIIVKNIL